MRLYPTEAQEQATLFEWVEMIQLRYPELSLMHHIPNGGSRNKREAANLKRQGVKAGVPDIFLPCAREGYHGLYIEMKAKDGKPSKAQLDFLGKVSEQGYATAICYGFDEARKMILNYLSPTVTYYGDNKQFKQEVK